MRRNQKGFTLVELIIAVAILAIVTAAVCGFIVVGSRSYASSNTDIMLQQDAQLALNQMSDVIIDTTDSISYGLSTSGSDNMQLVLKDSEFAGEATEKCLIVVNRHEDDSNNDNPSYWFYWSKEKETIYFNEVTAYSASMSPADVENAFKSAGDDKAILAQHVTDFSIDISQFEANRVVMISMTFENGNRTYSTSNNVTVRNRIALNEITVGPLRRAEDFEIDIVQNVTVEPGESINLGEKVTVESSSSDTALKWEFVGGEQNGTTLTDNGQLNINLSETRETFKVRVSRLNEEYAGQNDRVARTITVNVKRVTDVKINGPSSAKQGETISLTAEAIDRIGLLRMPCNGHPGAPYAENDKDVENWKLEDGSKAELVTNSDGSVSVKIANDATVGSKIVVWADSTLSRIKNYGPLAAPTSSPVSGKLEITVQEGEQGKAPLASSFKFGTENDEDVGMIYDYMYDGMSDFNQYVMCVRVREIGATNKDDDQVILYWSAQGKNMRFNPDIFGVDLHRSYEIYMQVLLPLDRELYEGIPNKEATHLQDQVDDKTKIAAEYKDHLDASGKYVGTRYEASKLFYGILTPPIISIQYNNVIYPNTNKDYAENYSLLSNKNPVVGGIYFYHDGVMNIKTSSLNKKIKFSIYKGEGDDINKWTRVAGYDPDAGQIGAYDKTSFANGEFTLELQDSGDQLLTSTNFIRRDFNISDPDAAGTYHIVPGYIYGNQKNLGNYDYILTENLNGDYAEHYFLQPDCAITLKIGVNLNMNVIYGGKSQGWVNFPLPTEDPFTWYSGAEWEQTFWGNYDIYTTKDGKEKTGITISNPTVKCIYNSSTGTYRIQLKKVENGSKGTVITDYGTYEWKPGDTEWSTYKPGDGVTMGDNSTWGTLIYFNLSGQEYMMEMPLPGANGWTFSGSNNTISQTMIYYRTDDLTAWYGQNAYFTLEWDDTNKILKLSFGNGGSEIGKWKLSADEKSWNSSN